VSQHAASPSAQFTNRLIDETSPYLVQHAHNPVDWYPWGEEALARARAENKPILLSIGYSACHWCHRMAHESFEDPETAGLMNQFFVPVKVDREERPDLDAIYMEAVQAMTGQGGWPMTVFLTPEGVPFYGGTYFPREPRYGMPGFKQLLVSLARAYQSRPQDIEHNATQMRTMLRQATLLQATAEPLEPSILDRAVQSLEDRYDARYGGFGGAPKFPPSMALEFLLRTFQRTGRRRALEMAEFTLGQMARGGMYDQLGGGFHRYSVDERWLVPHFEKMLYDNAQLARVYALAFQVTGNPFYRQITDEILAYVQREMTNAEGGFYSAQDADSEGEEGKFFVWSLEEVQALLGKADAELFARTYDVSKHGNFEGHNILHVTLPLDAAAAQLKVTPEHLQSVIDRARTVLFAARQPRVPPGLDDKSLTAWNGLMIQAFADAGRILARPDYVQAAVRAADFVWTRLRDPASGRLLRTYKDGRAKLNAYLEDYAMLANGLLALYQATFDLRWLRGAVDLAEQMIAHFWDAQNGGFFSTSDDHEVLITRPKDLVDSATPSANASATLALLTLGRLLDNAVYYQHGEAVLRLLRGGMLQSPGAFTHLLNALDFYLAPAREVAIVGDLAAPETQALLATVNGYYLPNMLLAAAPVDDAAAQAMLPLLTGRGQIEGRATAYVCENFACQLPVTTVEALRGLLATVLP
jgi:hypothetical protein